MSLGLDMMLLSDIGVEKKAEVRHVLEVGHQAEVGHVLGVEHEAEVEAKLVLGVGNEVNFRHVLWL